MAPQENECPSDERVSAAERLLQETETRAGWSRHAGTENERTPGWPTALGKLHEGSAVPPCYLDG